jgi:hypothetical protein
MEHYPGMCLEELGKSQKTSVRIYGVTAEIRTEHHYGNPVGVEVR